MSGMNFDFTGSTTGQPVMSPTSMSALQAEYTIPTAAGAGTGNPTTAKPGLFANGNILNMSPAKFASIAGGLGAGLSKPNSLSSRMGGFAQALGNQQMAAAAAQVQAKAHQTNLQELLKRDPKFVRDVLASYGNELQQPASGLDTPATPTTPKM